MKYDANEFDSIRPYRDDEMKQAVGELLADRQFTHMLQGLLPWMPRWMRNGIIRTAFLGVNSTLQFQVRFMKPIVKYILRRYTQGATFGHPDTAPGPERYTFISNHRDIVLDSAILDVLLHDEGFPTTCEVAIGDNLLIYPWIRTLVRINKAFIVHRSLSTAERRAANLQRSRYLHYVIQEKRENLWIAQREGRAKDSDDRTQEGLLKMMALCAEDKPIEALKALNIVPLSISYEYDPCDYLKAMEFQQKRDNPNWKKSKQDDLDNMKTGIFGQKGHVHYQTAPCINTWIDQYADTPRHELFTAIAQRMDREIHRGYRLFPHNYVAADLLSGVPDHAEHYTHQQLLDFQDYVQSRIERITLPEKDEDFLREKILRMYANPMLNKQTALAHAE